MKKFLMVAVMLVSAMAVSAQDYNWAIGVRGGGESAGLTVKKGMGGNALDFTANWGLGDASYLCVQGLYEWQYDLVSDLDWYWGVGAHVGMWDFANDGGLWLGVDAVIGLEYKFPSLPLAISVDYRPGFNVLPDTNVGWGNWGFGLKFCF